MPGGSIEPGDLADLILIDLKQAHLAPLMRPVASFVHQGRASDVVAVMVDGKWLMRERIVLTLDETAIVDAADRIARRAWAGLPKSPVCNMPSGFNSSRLAKANPRLQQTQSSNPDIGVETRYIP